jgi:hypothetical protein
MKAGYAGDNCKQFSPALKKNCHNMDFRRVLRSWWVEGRKLGGVRLSFILEEMRAGQHGQ